MLQPAAVFDLLRGQGFRLFTGVPDSLLKDFCAYVTDNTSPAEHVIAANEGNAVALAAGHYLATGRPGLVYLQNSGTGNVVNPLLSLADPEVYGIPMLLMIGWRGEPGVKDEPQHVKQGRVMTALLDAMEVPWSVLEASSDAAAVVGAAVARMRATSAPVALLVRKDAFAKYKLRGEIATDFPLGREAAIRLLVERLGKEDAVVSTTGMASRELYELRAACGDGHGTDFLTVGAMGHTASIALGVARGQPGRKVVCLDGDGSVLMHMGSLAVVGQSRQANLLHVVLNNGAHDSVGGQPTVGLSVDLPAVARACGYPRALSARTPAEIADALAMPLPAEGPAFLEIKVNKGARADLGRPKSTPAENKAALMKRLGAEAA